MRYENKKQYARAKVVRRLSDSPERETPRFAFWRMRWRRSVQHASVDLQQRVKCGTGPINETRKSLEVIADVPWGYRRRARLTFVTYRKHSTLQTRFPQSGLQRIVKC